MGPYVITYGYRIADVNTASSPMEYQLLRQTIYSGIIAPTNMSKNIHSNMLEKFNKFCSEHENKPFWWCVQNFARENVDPNIEYVLFAQKDKYNPPYYKNLRDSRNYD